MKTLVIYYSYTGKSKKAAEGLAIKEAADLVEVKEAKRRSTVNAYVLGSFAAMGRKQAKIVPLKCDFALYDKIILVMPIWAGHPAPAMNNVISLLPPGKEVELVFTSASGSSARSTEQTKALIAKKGCTVTKYMDVKA